jgi:putative two-component system response regulator
LKVQGPNLNLPDSKRETVADSVLKGMAVAAFTLAKLAGARSSDTANHIWRIQHYLKFLAKHLQGHPRFSSELTDPYINLLFYSAPLHNLGTLGIPDWILLKPGSLTSAEYAVMKTHTSLAHDVLEQVEKAFNYKGEPLHTLKEMVHSHHERWDGSGYPQGLSGEQIPLSARLMAIADVYEGLISNRVYKVGVPHDQAVAIMFQARGSHFDPDIVDAFIEIQDEFQAIAQRHADTDQDMQRMIEYMANAIAEEAELPAS